jgi:hypothetical protein
MSGRDTCIGGCSERYKGSNDFGWPPQDIYIIERYIMLCFVKCLFDDKG